MADSLETQTGWMNKAINRALSEVINSSDFLSEQHRDPWSGVAGEPPANGAENEDGEWVQWWTISMPIGSALLKPF